MHPTLTVRQARHRHQEWHPKSATILIASSFILISSQVLALEHHMTKSPAPRHFPRQNSGSTPLIITNSCGDTIYPGILTQSGTGPGSGGFELTAGDSQTLSVSENWQGRVWGRTNCTFNGGNSGQCGTGDCGGAVSCTGTGNVPVTLAEFTFDAGDGHTYYDISLVDGYNLPLAIVMHPDSNSSFLQIPQNLTNPSCVGTVGDAQAPYYNPYNGGNGYFLGTNASDPLPFENQESLSDIAQWCPWNLQQSSSTGPSGGVYIYPDGNLNRPAFDPCFSACSMWNLPQDCCTGAYGSPSSCQPSQYSQAAKAVCPDAYSYAFDDQTSTFIIPAGAGFEVIFCPGGRSTNIIATSKGELVQLAQQGTTSKRKRQTIVEMFEIALMHNGSISTAKAPSGAAKGDVGVFERAFAAMAALAFFAFLL